MRLGIIKANKLLIALFSFFTFIGLWQYLSGAIFDRMALDDFCYPSVVRRHGLLGGVNYWYHQWSGRFTATFLQSLFSTIFSSNGKIAILAILTLVVIILSLFFLVYNFFEIKKKSYLVLMALSLGILLYMITTNKPSTWMWLSGSATYVWSLALLILFLGCVAARVKYKYLYLIGFLAIFFSTGGNETLGLINISLIVLLLIREYFHLGNRKFYGMNAFLFLSLVFALGAFAIMYMAPGNEVRGLKLHEQTGWLKSIFLSIELGPQLLIKIVRDNWVLIFSFLVGYAVMITHILPEEKSKIDREYFKKRISNIFYTILALSILSVIYAFPGSRMLGELQPGRSHITLAFLIVLTILIVSKELGMVIRTYGKEKYELLELSAAYLLTIIFLFFLPGVITKTAHNFKNAFNYSKQYDEMIRVIKAHKGDKQTDAPVQIRKLPDSGPLTSATLRRDKKFWVNHCLSNQYGIKNGIEVR